MGKIYSPPRNGNPTPIWDYWLCATVNKDTSRCAAHAAKVRITGENLDCMFVKNQQTFDPVVKRLKGINWVSENLYLRFACSFYLHSSSPSHPPFVSGKHCKTCVWWAYGQTTHAQPGSETKNTSKIYVSDSNYQILNFVHQGSFYSKL